MKLYDCVEVIVCCKCVSCAVSTMKYLLAVVNVLFIILGSVIMGIGAYFMRDPYLNETYGNQVQDAGVAFVVLGVFTVITALIGCVGARAYNKKALLVYMGITFLIMCFQVYFTLEAYELATDGGVYALCVKRGTSPTAAGVIVGQDGKEVNCNDFTKNKLRVGSYGLWQNIWNDAEVYRCCSKKFVPALIPALDDTNCPATCPVDKLTTAMGYQSAYQLINQLQETGKCCGFGKPFSVIDTGGPSATDGCVTDDTGSSLISTKQYQRCFGYEPQSSTFTNNTKTKSLQGLYCKWAPGPTGPLGNLGCGVSESSTRPSPLEQKYQAYDFPAGTCPSLCYPFGCAQVIYEYVRNRLAAFSVIVLLLVLVNTFGFFSACCLALSHGFVPAHQGGGKGRGAAKQPLKAEKGGDAL
jgi:hypothetical protein